MTDDLYSNKLVIDWQSKYLKLKDEFDAFKDIYWTRIEHYEKSLKRVAENYEQHILQHHSSFATYLIEQAEHELNLI
jgi:hypothetical protein